MGLLRKLSQITLLGVVTMAIAVVAAAQALPKCLNSCGNISIPYPFGMVKGCYLDENFMVTCIRLKPKLGNISVEGIWLESHELRASQTAAQDCYKKQLGQPVLETNQKSSIPEAPQFTISGKKNKFTVLGCDTSGFLDGFNQGKQYQIGCSNKCPSRSNVISGSCSGIGCCQVDIPDGLTNVSVSVNSFDNHSQVLEFNPCGYAFAVNKDKFNFSTDYLDPRNKTVPKFPVVLQWAVGNETCQAARNKRTLLCQGNKSDCKNANGGRGYRCFCKQGYQGNPYLPDGGCKDIDECSKNLHNCTKDEKCHNLDGGFECSCRDRFKRKRKKGPPGCVPSPGFTAAISIVTTVSFAATLGVSFRLYLGHEKRTRQKFFDQNGGSDLEEKLQGQAKMFTVEELKKATKNFHKSGIIRHGGFGSFYRGNLANIGEVAIKKFEKSMAVNQSPKEQFIEEVVALSHIKHKNIVKLLGCCLETKIPLIVYEFIPNDTLFEYIHNGSKPSPINNMGNPPKEGVNIRNPPKEGLDIRDPPREGLDMGNPPKEGLDIRDPPKERLEMGNPPKERFDTRNPLEEGLNMGNPLEAEEGSNMENPPKEGFNNENQPKLGLWETRVKIVAEVAKALQKLHSATPKPLIHRNVKSANILLDENITTKVITAKVSDFGISGLFSQDQKELVQETLGYLDPEYLQTNQLTEKSDVYSFGVILVELLTGKEAFSKDNSEDKILAGYFLFHKEQNQLSKVLDKGIVEEGNEEQIKIVVELAEGCLKLEGNERPGMEYVAMKLESIRKTNIDPLDDP